MIKLNSKTTAKLNKKEIYKICKLKNIEWKYGINSQIEWFKKNIKFKDIHNLFWINDNLCGYTCLRKRTYYTKDKKNYYLLFDTLIIDKFLRGKGNGSLIMNFNNYIIKKSKLLSFLVCKKDSISFYKKHGWIKINKKNFLLKDYNYHSQYGMIFNEKFDKKKNKLSFNINK